MSDELGTYEIAYLCGGAERVAQVALFALYEQRLIRISRMHRVETVDGEPGEDILQGVALAEIPRTGRLLGPVVAAIAASPPVDGVAGTLQEAGLLSRPLMGKPRLSRKGRARRQELRSEGAGLAQRADGRVARFAALGTTAIEDDRLRGILESEDPKIEKIPRAATGEHRGWFNPPRRTDRGADAGGGDGGDSGGDSGGGGGGGGD